MGQAALMTVCRADQALANGDNTLAIGLTGRWAGVLRLHLMRGEDGAACCNQCSFRQRSFARHVFERRPVGAKQGESGSHEYGSEVQISSQPSRFRQKKACRAGEASNSKRRAKTST